MASQRSRFPWLVMMVLLLAGLTNNASASQASPLFQLVETPKEGHIPEEELRSLDISEFGLEEGPVDITKPALMERLVRLAYGRLGLMVRATGYDLRFELSDFRHYYPEDFDEVAWLDIVDMPEGEVVDISRERVVERTPDSTHETINYHASWGHHDPGITSSVDKVRLATFTLEDLVAEAQKVPDMAIPVAFTAYEVTVHLNGKTKTYQANFSWTGSSEKGTPVVVSDLIVTGVQLGLVGKMAGRRTLPSATPSEAPAGPDSKPLSSPGKVDSLL